MATYTHLGFLLVPYSLYYYQYSVKEIGGCLNEDMCKIHCILDTKCHYSTFQPSSSVCQLGYYGPGTAMDQYSNRGALRTFINPKTVAEAEINFYSFESADDIWPTKIYRVNSSIPNRESCASISMLVYDFFYYEATTLNCYLGLFSYSSTLVPTSVGSKKVLFFRKSIIFMWF